MGITPVRILLLADTHLGFDLPFSPRVPMRRRGPDFFANFERALSPALEGEADLVVHGGDLLYRSQVPPKLVEMAFAPLARVARSGVPVYLVPGNHERSKIPYPLLAAHRGVHIFDRPRTFALEVRGVRLALAGFPFHRPGVRATFLTLLEQTGFARIAADVRLLCLHEAIEGARVGPANFTFRSTPDVIRGRDLPPGFAAYLSGHIHRHQVLTRDLAGLELPAPFFYPGAIERTSFAERDEPKGFMLIEATPGAPVRWRFSELPARPMLEVELDVDGQRPEALAARVRDALACLDPDGVVRLRPRGRLRPDALRMLCAPSLRSLAPASMNVSVPGLFSRRRRAP